MHGLSSRVYFATSNRHKLEEASLVLKKLGIIVEPLEGKGTEIQADDLSQIARNAALSASVRFKKPLIVEDAGLFISSLGGFPGPYSAYVFRKIGIEGVLRLLKNNTNRPANFKSSVAYCEPGGSARVFEASLGGRVVQSACGENGFGFDPIFAPLHSKVTLADMSLEEKCRVSHRAKSLRKFAAWWNSNLTK
jgi:XTP/dITP diphosphohydrolase